MVFNRILNGISGNLSQVPLDELHNEYGPFLIEDETIEFGFTLIRDAVIFTNIRILFVDKQGASGSKRRFKSIFLSNIIDVDIEVAGFGLDDSQLDIYYLTNAKLHSHAEHVDHLVLEFPKKSDIMSLYKYLFTLAYNNRLKINK